MVTVGTDDYGGGSRGWSENEDGVMVVAAASGVGEAVDDGVEPSVVTSRPDEAAENQEILLHDGLSVQDMVGVELSSDKLSITVYVEPVAYLAFGIKGFLFSELWGLRDWLPHLTGSS